MGLLPQFPVSLPACLQQFNEELVLTVNVVLVVHFANSGIIFLYFS
jgi:hypothetical protein